MESHTPPQSSPTSSTLSARAHAVASLLTVTGVGLAIYLVRVKLRLEFDPSFQSSCNFGSAFNCDVVQTSSASMVFGYPLALWGAATYVAVLGLLWGVRRGGGLGRGLHACLAWGGLAVCAHSVYLAYLSTAVIGAYCLYCIGMYVVNVGLTALLWRTWRRRPTGQQGPTWASAMGLALVALLTMGGLSVVIYGSFRAQMREARIAMAKRELERRQTATKQENAAPRQTPNQAATSATSRPTSAPQPQTSGLTIKTHQLGFRYSEEVLRKGRSFFEVPVHPGDFALGPETAPVTIVEFADFECGYCRALTANMKPLKSKYKDKVRWVFKHFPLDNACNKVMKGTQHPDACVAAKAANCAGEQGKFWAMHDRIYERKLRINVNNLRAWALEVGVNARQYDACFADERRAHAKTQRDSIAGRFARIAGTPRTYINGHLVPGVNATEVLDYYIQAALKGASQKKSSRQGGPAKPQTSRIKHDMVSHEAEAGRAFWIDRYEASVDDQGRAVPAAGKRPAEASWYEAKAACTKAGKRLCTEREWVTACTGELAIDNNGNGDFTDDAVEGWLFPYGPFHEAGRCNDNRKGDGPAVATGSMPKCVSPAGVFDQSANLAEWTGNSEDKATLSGTDFRWGAKASCMRRERRFGLGYRNATTGFRCCAETAVPPPAGAKLTPSYDHGATQKKAPQFRAQLLGGGDVTEEVFQGKVTIVSFFASWCGPCRRELPDLEKFYQEHQSKGVRVLAFGVDTKPKSAEDFVKSLKLHYKVALDPEARVMGAFGVKGMPTAFLVDSRGVIQRRLVGINAAKVAAFKEAALQLLR